MIAALAVAGLAVSVYVTSLGNGFTYDDVAVAVSNEAAHDPLAWRTIFLTPSWLADAIAAISYRPLTTWTFAIQHALHGSRPLGYHVVNVIGHAAVSGLVVMLAVAVGLPVATGTVAGALFAVHPIHTEAVANVAGRAEILAAGLGLLALIAQRRAATAARPAWWFAAAAGTYALALLAKENAVPLLAVFPVADFVVSDGRSLQRFIDRSRGSRGVFYAAITILTAGYLVLRSIALGSLVGPREGVAFWMNPLVNAPAAVRILTALDVQARAATLLVLPVHLSADYSYRHVVPVQHASEPRAFLGMAVALGLALLVVVSSRRATAVFWFALALLPWSLVSNVAFPIGTIFGERLLYLPSVGFCALVAMALPRQPSTWRRVAATAGVIAIVMWWSTLTLRRNLVWRDDLALAESAVASAPDSGHAHHILGNAYSDVGRDTDALRQYRAALAIDRRDTTSAFNSAVIHQRNNRPNDALVLLRKVVKIDPRHFPAWINIASTDNTLAMFGPALDAAERAVAIRADVPNGWIVKANALRGLGRLPEARTAFEEAVRLAPESPDAILGVGATALDQEDFPAAATAFRNLVELVPSDEFYRGLVYSLRRSGRAADAAMAAARARQRFPADAFFGEDRSSRN